MAVNDAAQASLRRVRYLSWFLLLMWTGCIAASLFWNLREERAEVYKSARHAGQVAFENDVLYRRWAATHGGVYVPVSEHTPPNPYLKVPNRDLAPTAGPALTLVNPAYMSRQVNEMSRESSGTKRHITSLNPIRPQNAADAWERQSLEAFVRGEKEVSTIAALEGEEHLRFMRPFVTEASCLKCHASQGYRIGDIRGGVSVSVPTAPLWAIHRPVMVGMSLVHGALWIVGLAGIVVATGRLRRDIDQRQQAEAALRQSEAQTRRQKDLLAVTLASIGDAVIATDVRGHVTFLNAEAERLTGWTNQDAAGQPLTAVFRIINEQTRQSVESPVEKVLRVGGVVGLANHTVLVAKDGRETPIDDSGAPVRSADGIVHGVVLVFRDIAARYAAERALKESETKYRTLFQNMAEEVHFWQVVRDEAGQIKTWRLVDANPPTLETWGHQSIAEIRGKTTDEIFGPGATEHYIAVVRKIMTEGVPHTFEDYFPHLDKHFRFTSVPLGEYFITTGADITAIKKGQEALRESEARFRLALKNSPVLITMQDVNLVYRWVFNTRTRRPEEVVGKTDADLFAPEEAAAVSAAKREVLATGKDVHRTFWLTSNGERVFLDCYYEPVRDAAGRIIGVGGASVNLTEQKRAEDAAAAAHLQLQSVIDGTTSLIYACDVEARFVFVNAALAALLKTTPAQMLGKRRHEFMPQEDADRHEANDREVMAAGRAVEFEEHSELPGRSITWLSTKFPLRDAQGRIYAVAGIVTDITERKQTEEALRESEERFRLMGDTIPYGAWMADAKGRNIYISPLFLELLGRSFEEVKEFGWTDKMPPEDVEPVMRRWMECVRTGQDWEGELRFPSPNGRLHTILSRGKPVRDSHGQVQAWVGVNLDITERKVAEEGLKQANAALAEADRRKDEFIAVLSHELRNPLAPIRYALPLLGEERLGAAGRRATEVIDRQVAQLSRLVDDLLDVSRITAGKFELRREHVTLRGVMSAAVEAASPAMAAAGHSLDISAPDSPVWLHADAARISQAITNLLNNSARYTPQGGCIRLEARADQGHCVIRVTDNGIGIAPKALPTLFERFRQVRDKQGPQGGLGIGLALTKQLVEMHEGTIEAHSAGENRGAEFVIRLPLAAVAPGPQEQQARPCGKTACLRVLVVDDNVDLVEVLAMVMEAAGHQVRKAFDGRSAVSAALEYQPHVILLDLGMPEMDGTEVVRELRRHPEMAGTRIIALTGWGQDDDRRRTAEAGFDEHLTKPTDPQQVLRILGQVATRTAT